MSEDPTEPASDDTPTSAGTRTPYRNRIAVEPGDPPVAYRPGNVLVDERTLNALKQAERIPPGTEVEAVFALTDDNGNLIGDVPPFGQWHRISGLPDAPRFVELINKLSESDHLGLTAQLDVVYFANGHDCCGCPPHPALVAEYAAAPWHANPWHANPWHANPWRANPWSANPWRANAEQLNVLATGKPPTSSVMPALEPSLPDRSGGPTGKQPNGITIGVLDSGLAGGWDDATKQRPELLGTGTAALDRISGPSDPPSQAIGNNPADDYLDPVAGHGTFIAGIIEQLTPGCTIRVERVFEPEGDVGAFELAQRLWQLMATEDPQFVNLSFGGTGRDTLFEKLIEWYHQKGVAFVAAAGNEGSCVAQYPAALESVIGVAGLGPMGPAEWSNYGPWVDACAPGTDLVSAFYAKFDGAAPRINGIDSDDFKQWATWTGTSFAAPVVVAALARERATTGCTPHEAVERVIRAPHLARLPNMGTVVNF